VNRGELRGSYNPYTKEQWEKIKRVPVSSDPVVARIQREQAIARDKRQK